MSISDVRGGCGCCDEQFQVMAVDVEEVGTSWHVRLGSALELVLRFEVMFPYTIYEAAAAIARILGRWHSDVGVARVPYLNRRRHPHILGARKWDRCIAGWIPVLEIDWPPTDLSDLPHIALAPHRTDVARQTALAFHAVLRGVLAPWCRDVVCRAAVDALMSVLAQVTRAWASAPGLLELDVTPAPVDYGSPPSDDAATRFSLIELS